MQRRDLSGKRFGRLYVLNRYRTVAKRDRKSTRLNSSHSQISYAVFCLKKKKNSFTEQGLRCLALRHVYIDAKLHFFVAHVRITSTSLKMHSSTNSFCTKTLHECHHTGV